MAKFNRPATRPAVASPIATEAVSTALSHEGRAGYARDAKGELFLLAVSNMVGERSFYEQAQERDGRYAALARQVALADAGWMLGFLGWLRGEGNMRSASLVAAAEAVKARLDAAKAGQAVANGARNRQLINAVLQRADEPGELLAYWTSRYGRAIPKPVKRGVGDAVQRLYTERNLLKYDTDSHGFRFADVIELVHPSPDPGKPWQGDLFRLALDRRHGRPAVDEASLRIVTRNRGLREAAESEPDALLNADALREAGMTWEDALSLVGSKVDKAKLWEALIPSMGYMAVLRNLRNFDQAGVSDAVAGQVAARLADPEQVAKSRQFPFRFFAAHNAVGSLRWGHALERALQASLANVPALPGRTLVVVDQSPSMFPGFYFSTAAAHRDISNADLAKLFGAGIALRAEQATLAGYGAASYAVPFSKGDALLRLVGKFHQVNGTDTFGAVAAHFDRHDRVLIITDEQNNSGRFASIDEVVPAHVPVYTWNIGGYRVGATASGLGNRHTFGGLTDAAFRLVSLLEAGRNASWPWLQREG